MTLDQLRVFVAVAEREHVTMAARALNMTQSATSAAIAALEARHGLKLFDRVGRGVVLTAEGRCFLEEARAVIARADAAGRRLDDLAGLRQGSLRIIASQTIAAYGLPPVLSELGQLYPGVAIDLAIGNTRKVADAIANGQADLGFAEGAVDDPTLVQRPIVEDRLQLVRSAPFPRSVDPEWLLGARWIVRERGSGTRSTLENHLRDIGVDPAALDIALTLPSNESVRTAVEAGAGLAALSSLVVRPALAAGALHTAGTCFGRRAFFALHHRQRHQSKVSGVLLDMMARTAQTGAGSPGLDE